MTGNSNNQNFLGDTGYNQIDIRLKTTENKDFWVEMKTGPAINVRYQA